MRVLGYGPGGFEVTQNWRMAPLGDACLIVEFGQRVDAAINARVHDFAAHLLAGLQSGALPGIVDVVPAFTTVALHYRPEAFASEHSSESPYETLRQRIEALLTQGIPRQQGTQRTVEIPVCYGGAHGPDLEEVAHVCGITPQQLIDRHIASAHRVYMLGFVPGLAYIGGLDTRLAVPRRSTPRTQVPAGSVAIARDQTCIYPLASPGGWNLIGRTPLRLFDADQSSPCLLQPGDAVRFVPISAEALDEALDEAFDKAGGGHP